jgi:cytochrome P450
VSPSLAPVVLDVSGTDHHAQIARLHRLGPVVPVLLPAGVPAWVITRHHLLAEWLRDPRVSKDWRNWNQLSTELMHDWPLAGMFFVTNMFTADGEQHRRLRSLVSSAFTARRVHQLRPAITRIVEDLLQELPAHADPTGVIDLRRHFAYRLAMQVICTLLGVPEHQRDRFRALVEVLFRTDTTPAQAAATEHDRQAMLADLIAQRRREPGDDLTSALLAAQTDDPDVLSAPVLADTLWLFVTAGHETTLNLITNAIHALCTHPEQRTIARSGGDDVWAAVVEETLRWAGPIDFLTAGYPLEDITIAGVTIGAGDAVLGLFGGVGHDVDQHGPNAHVFDITHTQKGHLAFGGGPHYCLGAPLARLEATIGLHALFARHPDLTLATEPGALTPLPSLFSHSFQTLPARLDAAGDAQPAAATMVRALNALKQALKASRITATLTSQGTSRAVLHLPARGIDVTCRPHPTHQAWWLWIGDEAIAPAEDPTAAAAAITTWPANQST